MDEWGNKYIPMIRDLRDQVPGLKSLREDIWDARYRKYGWYDDYSLRYHEANKEMMILADHLLQEGTDG